MISIVIPIFNVAAYLPQCMKSVLSQSVEGQELEIILVDDGSTDECPVLCDEYVQQDTRVRVIHKKNGGLSDARNAGMRVAQGEWIFFLDSDDWLAPDAIKKLYTFAIENSCDVVQGNQYYAYHDHLLYRSATKMECKTHILDNNSAMRELIINDRVKNFAWGKLYKTGLIKNLDFPVGRYFEDSYWQHLVFAGVGRYGIIDEPIVYYRQREDSISGKPSVHFDDLIEGYRLRLDFVKENYPQYVSQMKKTYQKVYEQRYPKTGVTNAVTMLINRVKAKLFPAVKYIKVEYSSKC